MVISLTPSAAAAEAMVTEPASVELSPQPAQPLLGGEVRLGAAPLTSDGNPLYGFTQVHSHDTIAHGSNIEHEGPRVTSFSDITDDLARQAIELPSWAFGNSGTRFKVFAQPGVPRDPFEKLADAAQVHPSHRPGAVGGAAHPVGPRRRLRQARRPRRATSASASARSTPTRSRTTTTSSAACATSTSGCGPRPSPTCIDCVDIMDVTGSRDLKVWLPDGTQLPGPGRPARPPGPPRRLARSRSTPGSATTSGWCSSTSSSSPRSTPPTCPTGARPTSTASPSASGRSSASTPATTRPGTNIEFIVMQLLRLGPARRVRLQLPLLRRRRPDRRRRRPLPAVPHPVRGGARRRLRPDSGVSFMLDQCHNIEAKIPGQIRSVLNVQEMTARALLVDRDALAEAEAAGDVLAGQRGHDGRLLHRRPRRPRRLAGRVGACRPTRWPPTRQRLRRAHRRRPRRRRPGRVGGLTCTTPSAHLLARSHRLGADPRNTNYAGRQHVGQGHRRRPRHRRARRAAVGQGLGRRPRHAHRGRPGRAAPRPPARPRRRLSRRRARGRDGGRVRLLLPRQGRRGAVDRHRDARPRRRRPRRPPPPRQRHRHRHRGRRRAAHQGDLRRPRRVGPVAPPRLPARSRHRRDPRRQPAGDRRDPRRPRHHRLGRHQRRGRGQLALDHRHGAQAHIDEPRRPAAVRRASSTSAAPLARARAPGQGRRPRPARAGHRLGATSRWSATSPTTDVVLDFLAGEKLFALAALGTVVPRPLPAHQGQAARARPPGRPPRSRSASPGWPSSTTAYRADYARLLRAPRRPRTRRPCGAPTRRSCWCPASACSPSARTSRRPGWRASSTSTRST